MKQTRCSTDRSNARLRRGMVVALMLVLLSAGLGSAQSSTARGSSGAKPAYLNPQLPIAERVRDLVSRMTLEEKVRQMQHTAPAIPRLKVPSYDWWNEALHGVARAGYATVFPQAIGMAATWDSPLVYQEGRTISVEARAKYNQAQRVGNHSIYFGLTFWAPNINLVRDPRWGRGQETLGEDPFLTGTLATAYVKGMQGDNPKYLEVVATPKHYAAYSGPEPLRHGFNANLAPQDLEATYLPAFRAAITQGHADSVMCAYNAVDGVPACANTYLLQKTLRDAWGFDGYVTSDCGAIADITFGHHYTKDNEHGSAVAVKAGTDTTCGNEYVTLVKAVHDGLISESAIDQAVTRLFTARFRLGMFDPPSMVPFDKIPYSEDDSPAHRALALRAARESMVLLKNDGVLPLKSSVRTIAVIGPNADSLAALEGNYHGTPSHPVLPVDGMTKQFAGKARVLYAQGAPYVPELPLVAPRTLFHPAQGSQEDGLRGEYFPNTNFSGKPVLDRIDPEVQFDWNAAAPAPGVPMKAFSVRWTGTLTPPAPGDYTFTVNMSHCGHCDVRESVRVYMDGKLVFGSSQSSRRAKAALHVHFADTRPHAFRIDYSHSSPLFGAGITLAWQPPVDALSDEAVSVAKQSDVVVAFVGLSPHLEGEEMPIHIEGFDGGDRTDINLPPVQLELLEALAATRKPLVVVLLNGSALAVNWAEQHANAILEAWYPGEAGGTAIAETLAGVNNPGGRLPVTFYASLSQLPAFEDYSMHNRTYRYFAGKPLFGFGFGLSYSSFAFSGITLSSTSIRAGQPLTVTADVRNTSARPGDEVAELYLQYPDFSGAPLRALKGFDRVHLAPGQTRRVAFMLSPRDLGLVNEEGDHLIRPGSYHIFVGGSQPWEGEGVSASFDISGAQKLPR